MKPFKCARCQCGRYTAAYAVKLSHTCSDEPQSPEKRGPKTSPAKWAEAELRAAKWAEACELRAAKQAEACELRAQGLKLREIGARMGISRQRVDQLIKASGQTLCRWCRLPVELLAGKRGYICDPCYRDMMADRPSKVARRTGYRTNKAAHRRATAVKLAREGKTIREISDSLGVVYYTVWKWFKHMRKAGRDIKPTLAPRGHLRTDQLP